MKSSAKTQEIVYHMFSVIKKGLSRFDLNPFFVGATERSRTAGLMITNQLLYQLSYGGL